jgi:hypothetical protein
MPPLPGPGMFLRFWFLYPRLARRGLRDAARSAGFAARTAGVRRKMQDALSPRGEGNDSNIYNTYRLNT